MAFTCTLYNISDENNKLTKTLPSSGSLKWANAPCIFKDENDYLNPHIIVKGTANQITGKNYLVISGSGNPFLRHYFIENVTAVANELWDCQCHEDVLMTYNADIKGLSGTVERQENTFNLYLNDPNVNKLAYPLVQVKAFPEYIKSSDYQFYLITAGGY